MAELCKLLRLLLIITIQYCCMNCEERVKTRLSTLVQEGLKTTADYIEQNDFIAETHEVTTDDGYINLLHRVRPKWEKRFVNGSKNIVLLAHGLPASSINWVMAGPKSFPFFLAHHGFDVWLWNARGTVYSNRHVNLSITDPKFWDFSFHEQGIYDMPAAIDYILQQSGQQKLFLVGHSKGSTCAYVMLSLRPEYNNKIRLLVSLAPAAYLKHARSPILQTLFRKVSPIRAEKLRSAENMFYMPGIAELDVNIRKHICGGSELKLRLCSKVLFRFGGFNFELMNKSMIPSLFMHFPAGGSVKELLHFIQIGKSDRFAMYNSDGKRKIPAMYPTSNISAPVLVFYGLNDLIVSKKDLDHVVHELPNVVAFRPVNHPKFNHGDFLWAKSADELVYHPTLKYLTEF